MSMKHMNTYVKKQKHKLENWAFLKKAMGDRNKL